MSGAWPWIAALVVAVASGILAVRAQRRRDTRHEMWLRDVLLSDREVQQIRQRYQQPARKREEYPRA